MHKSEERYRYLVEAIAQIIWYTKASGEFLTPQPRWSAFTGQTDDELKGWGWLNAVHPDDQQHTMQVWSQAIAKRTLYEVEHRLRRSDGEYRYMSVRAVPILEPDGSIGEWAGVHMDITERKQVEKARDRALAEAEAARAELQRVFMQAPAAISTSRGADHIIEIANPMYAHLVGKRDLQGLPTREAFPELAEQGFFELLDRVYTSGDPFVGKEMRAVFDRNGDGTHSESFWNFVYQPLVDADGQVYGIMTHAVEVTEQVRSRQEIEQKAAALAKLTKALERSNHELEQFAYIASHDLKAPLRAIVNLSEWIEEDFTDQLAEESRQYMNLLRGRVHRMEALIDGILQYSRAGRVQRDLEKVNVTALVSEAVQLLDLPAEVSIVVDPMPIVKTERMPLQQIFLNLLDNAIKHARRSDVQVHVSVREEERYYEFSVTDNGQGIAPQYHQKIWIIFQRLEARDKVEGTGIGLSIVKKIVESRGGRAWIESELGSGATFRFTWPKHS